jgi:hypothetical protein
MHSVYISNSTTHIIFTTVFTHNQCSDISVFENYSSTDIYKTTKQPIAALHMETIRTARLHERKGFKMPQKKLAWCYWNSNNYVILTS